MPDGVTSNAQASTSATGKPTPSNTISTGSTNSGAWNAGNTVAATCTISHATMT